MLSSLKKVVDKGVTLVKSNFVMFFAAFVIIYLLMNYGNTKSSLQSGMTNSDSAPTQTQASAPAATTPDNEFQSVQGITTSTHGLPAACMKQSTVDPKELLPKDANSDWASLNPNGSGELSEVNLLKAGHQIGINTTGQSLRNANLQIRSEPPNPQMNVGPWHQTTIEPDTMRVPLELGQGNQ